MLGELEQPVLVDGPHGAKPVFRHAIGEQDVVRVVRKQRRLDVHHRRRRLGIERHFLDSLPDLDQLCRAGARMPLDPPPLRPRIGLVVMIDVAQQDALLGLVHDQANVAADPY
jgi:hypothetical protein